MNNDSVYATYDDEVTVYTDPDYDPEGQRQIALVSDTWYPGTCEVSREDRSESWLHMLPSLAFHVVVGTTTAHALGMEKWSR